MAAPRVSFGEKDMENGGDGAAERSRKWSQAPGNIEDLGEHTPSRHSASTRLTSLQTSTLLCRSTSLPTETPRPTMRRLRPPRVMRPKALAGNSGSPTRAPLPLPTLASSPRRCSRPISSRVSPLLRSRTVASATVGTKSPPRRRTCSSSSSVSSLALSSMVSLLTSATLHQGAHRRCRSMAPWRRSFVLLLQALIATRSYGQPMHPTPLAETLVQFPRTWR